MDRASDCNHFTLWLNYWGYEKEILSYMSLICFVQKGVSKPRIYHVFPFHECEKCRLTITVDRHDYTDDRQMTEFDTRHLKMWNEREQTCDLACVIWHVWSGMCDLTWETQHVWFDLCDLLCIIWDVWLTHVWLGMCDSKCLCVIWDLWFNMCDLTNNVAPMSKY